LIRRELSMAKFEWDHPGVANTRANELVSSNVTCATDIYEAAKDAHAICLITEWDEFKVW
jgi:UDPglucose 6-dehydrogenase